MGTYLRLTPALRSVLTCFLESDGAQWGLLISSKSGKPTGTVYPLLERLERAGFVTSFWEDETGRPGPRRRLYSLLPEGREWAMERLGR
ncbi:PadR family transcriptional regulator [Sinomonas terrae]|uniref:PadR family transcriptional regulator n=1 Tax=Sinomonas terrae TaxID=2908838 RepID=A0ABS9U1Q5_9MICC|nr:PadR family transcriptional regulator [Sinomonas terrae]MCH6470245.1 PadR family transcriptional regulator [Sinomonas terrae]